jgi:spore coat polysaccharide biosynthesis predicted glycosyltransferase SpsG
MLREQFKNRALRYALPTASKILVTFGGGKSENLLHSILDGLLSCNSLSTLEIIPVVSDDSWGQQLPIKPLINPYNMAELMASVDLAISGGGTTTWELAHMGVPSICISRGRHERVLIVSAAVHGVVVDGGSADRLDIDNFVRRIKYLISAPGTRGLLTLRGQSLTDGEGAGRVVDVILENTKHGVER